MYQALQPTYDHLIQYSKLYDIDLTEANQKEVDGDKYGAQPNDINLDICGSIHDYFSNPTPQSLLNFVIQDLEDWAYDFNTIAEAIANTKLEVQS